MIWLSKSKLKNFKTCIRILVGSAFLELLTKTCKILFVYKLISNTLQIFLFEKGVSEGDVPPISYENFAIFKPNLRDLMHNFR